MLSTFVTNYMDERHSQAYHHLFLGAVCLATKRKHREPCVLKTTPPIILVPSVSF